MGSLRELFPGGTLRLLIQFLLRPERELHFRSLQEHTKMGTGALQRELARFLALGLVSRNERGGKVYYQPVADHPSWEAFRMLVRQHGDPVEVVREALRDVPGIQAAFVFGSTVSGGARADSDVDVLIVEEGMPLAAIGRATSDAQALLHRLIDVKRYTPVGLAARLRRGNEFLQEVIAGPKAWLIGSEDALAAR